jgi:cellulose synthase/poly-beta-1,6-N-acetylglucosamine synthase-like glycosyltransferase
MIATILFWLSLGILIYVYFGFGFVLFFISKFIKKPIQKNDILPSVSLITCAYNEEKHILRKIENCLELDYPKDRLEIIVVSDGSTDNTNNILKGINNPIVTICYMSDRNGKTECQNIAVEMSRNEILFFTDATTIHPPDVLKILLRSLYDPSIGCVTGRGVQNRDDSLISGGLSKRSKYRSYQRKKLHEVNTLFGAHDRIYAIPRRLYSPVRRDLNGGFVAPLQILEKGYRTVYEPEAVAFVARRAATMEDEFTRQSRMVLRGMRGLLYMARLMNPFKHGFMALSLVSTTLLRWLSPVFLFVLFLSNTFLLDAVFYWATFFLQAGFYVLGFTGFLLEKKAYRGSSLFHVPLCACVLLGSTSVALKRLLAGETGQTWETRR